MKIEAISNTENLNFGKTRKNKAKITTHSPNLSSKSSGADSILLHFAGLLAALGFKKPLNKLICTLHT